MFLITLVYSLIYLIIIFFGSLYGLSPLIMIRDYYQIENLSIFSGLISILGIISIYINSSICLFTFTLIKNKKYKPLLFIGGIFSFILASDDLLMIHERLNELQIFTMYFIFCLIFIYLFFKVIKSLEYNYLILSLLFLSSSLIIDIFQFQINLNFEKVQIIEEFLKFVGYGNFFFFWLKSCRSIIYLEIRSKKLINEI